MIIKFFLGNSHPVEGTINENQGDEKEASGQTEFQADIGHRHGDFHSQQTEQSREFDDRIQGNRRGILERVADGVADNGRFMQRSVLHLQINFDDLLAVIPATAGIGHEDRLEEAEEGDADQIADEEVGVEEGQRQSHEEDDDEDVDHPLLGVVGTNLDDFLAVFDRGFFLIQFDVLLDEHNGLIGAGDNGLDRSAGKPVNDAAAHEQAQDDFRLDKAKFGDNITEEAFQQDDDTEHHGGGADDGSADEHRLGRGFKGIARAVGGFQKVLGLFKVRFNAVVLS